VIDADIAWAAAPRVLPATPVRKPRRSRAGVGAAFVAVAATALLGFWLLSPSVSNGVPAGAAAEYSEPAESARTPDAPVTPQAELPDVLPLFTPPPAYVGEQDITASDPVGVPFEAVQESAATLPSPEPEVPRATSGFSTTSRPPALDDRVRPVASTATAMPRDVARAEPAPSSPLAPPVESPIRAPETRRSPGPSGGAPLAREVTPLPAAPAPASTAAPAAPAATSSAIETSAVRGVLDGYADAFSTLNADATQRVWPGVDVRGLRRAFDQLSTQNITFNRCEVNASGETAQAVCTGRATWVPKVGDRSPKSEPRTWRFALGRDDGEWVIDGVQVQR
jgi:hypothetical protein